MDRTQFLSILQENPGVVVVKYSATWCKPCKIIEPYVAEKKRTLPKHAVMYELDVDDDFDLYAHLKSKKQVVGVPVLLAYKKDNLTPYSDMCVSGTNTAAIDTFFNSLSNMNMK